MVVIIPTDAKTELRPLEWVEKVERQNRLSLVITVITTLTVVVIGDWLFGLSWWLLFYAGITYVTSSLFWFSTLPVLVRGLATSCEIIGVAVSETRFRHFFVQHKIDGTHRSLEIAANDVGLIVTHLMVPRSLVSFGGKSQTGYICLTVTDNYACNVSFLVDNSKWLADNQDDLVTAIFSLGRDIEERIEHQISEIAAREGKSAIVGSQPPTKPSFLRSLKVAVVADPFFLSLAKEGVKVSILSVKIAKY